MRKLVHAVILIALTIGLVTTACGGKSTSVADDIMGIQNTIYAYTDAYNAQDYEGCLTYMTGWDVNNKDYYISWIKIARTATGIVTIKSITDVIVTGNTATANISSAYTVQEPFYQTDNGTPISHFRKEGNTWKYLVTE